MAIVAFSESSHLSPHAVPSVARFLRGGVRLPIRAIHDAEIIVVEEPQRKVSQHDGQRELVLSQEEVSLLDAAGLLERPLPRPDGIDSVAEARLQREAMVASAMSIQDTAELLGVGVSEIEEMIEGRTLAVLEVDGHQLVPRFQFSDDGLVPSFGEIYRLTDPDLPLLTFYRWFILPSQDLPSESEDRDLSPKEWLNANFDPTDLYLAARCLPGGW